MNSLFLRESYRQRYTNETTIAAQRKANTKGFGEKVKLPEGSDNNKFYETYLTADL